MDIGVDISRDFERVLLLNCPLERIIATERTTTYYCHRAHWDVLLLPSALQRIIATDYDYFVLLCRCVNLLLFFDSFIDECPIALETARGGAQPRLDGH